MFRIPLGEDTFLEKVELRHADAFLRVTTPIRADIGRYFSVKETAEDWRTWIGEYRDLDAQDAGLACGIWRGGELVGMICFLEISRHYLSGSLACWMVPDARGGGLAARATQAMTTYAFEALLLERVVIRVATDNFASQRVPERLGFRFEGVARSAEVIREQFLDVAIYAVLADEWADACVRAERRNAARIGTGDDARWITRLPALALDPAAPPRETLVVGERAALGLSGDGQLTHLTTGDDDALRTLLARADGDLRRRGVPLLRARLAPGAAHEDAAALRALGFFALGDRTFARPVGDLALTQIPEK
jgi:ribosomal-protein-serine acetyltransferase